MCGTPCYIAPETSKMEPYSVKVDCWALGVLAYELVQGKLEDSYFLSDSINRDELKYDYEPSSEYRNLVYSLLSP